MSVKPKSAVVKGQENGRVARFDKVDKGDVNYFWIQFSMV